MKVKELIEILSKYDPETVVVTGNDSNDWEDNKIEPMYTYSYLSSGNTYTQLNTEEVAKYCNFLYAGLKMSKVEDGPKGVYLIINRE